MVILIVFAMIGITVVGGVLYYLIETKCPKMKSGISNIYGFFKEKISNLKEERKRKKLAAHMSDEE